MSASAMLWILFGVFVLLVIYGIPRWVQMRRHHGEQAADERVNADERLAALFDGSSSVAYVPTEPSGGLPLEVLIKAAADRDYRFVAETGRGIGRRVIFERVSAA